MMLSVFADAVVAALLIATISYAAVLNRRLGILRGDRGKLEELVTSLTVATQRAEGAVAALKSAANDTGRQLEKRIEQGKGMHDDLTYMLERAGPVADRLEGVIRARRDDAKPESWRRAEPRRETSAEVTELRPEPRVRAEAADQRSRAEAPEPRARAEASEPRSRGEAPNPRVRADLKAGAVPAAEPEPARRVNAPSRAERDLLRALSSLR